MNTVSIAPTGYLAPKPTAEALSPFLPWTEAELSAADVAREEATPEPSFVADVLAGPERMVARFLEPGGRQIAIVGSIALICVAQAAFAAVVMSADREIEAILRAALMLPLAVLLAVASALGPVYATSVIVAARLPTGRLIAAILGAVATGSLVLGALSPIPYAAMKYDALWVGPLALLGVFGLSGLASGVRAKRLFIIMAEEVRRRGTQREAAELSYDERFRVNILARVAMVMLAFTSALAFWSFDPFF